jgi:hypothetical protein
MPRACLTLLCLLFAQANTPIAAPPAGFTEAPLFVSLFTPRGVPDGTYRTYVSSEPLATILPKLAADPSLRHGNGSFEAQSVIAADAFGQSGTYNRWKVALLYGAQRVRVARGPRLENGRVVEAWTLISPYPDTELNQLNPGTLLIVLHLPR